jgi:hypothetical protein
MHQNNTQGTSLWTRLRQGGQCTLVAGLLLGLPALAIGFLKPWGATSEATTIAAEDDPLANGLQILEPPIVSASNNAKGGHNKPNGGEKAEGEVLLNDWTYTDDRPRPSPGH